MKRDDELLQEIDTVKDAISSTVDDDFVSQLTRSQMQRRLGDLQAELLEANQRTFEFRFVDVSRPNFHGISTSLLSTFLSKIQSTITYGAWATFAGSEVSGYVPASIERSAMTEVVAMPTGSFGLVLQKSNNDFATEFDQTVELIVDLVEAAIEQRLDDDIASKVQALGRESSQRLQTFVKKVSAEGLDTEITWSNPQGLRSAYLTEASAAELSSWLSQMSPEIESQTILGYLRRADTINGSFKIESQATSAMYEGKGEVAMLAHTEMDALYRAELEVVTYNSTHTGRTVSRTRLIGLTLESINRPPTLISEESPPDRLI
jgi:hypothetical protein